jgi:hypothetical protein
VKITGEAIHNIVRAIVPDAEPQSWDEFNEQDKATIKAMAARIQELYITPLQGVVRKYQDLVEAYHNLTDSVDDLADSEWREEKGVLDARELILLGEEPPQ